MLPAGEIWSVVMLSPSTAKTLACWMLAKGGGWRHEILEEWSFFDVRRFRVKRKQSILGGLECLPLLTSGKSSLVASGVHLRVERATECFFDRGRVGPDLAQVDGFPSWSKADRLGGQIDVYRTHQCKRHDEHR